MLEWQGRDVRFSLAAYHEMVKYDLNQFDILEVLEIGETLPTKRKQGITEKCIKKKEGLLKIVVCESFEYSSKKEVFVIIHIALIKKPKKGG